MRADAAPMPCRCEAAAQDVLGESADLPESLKPAALARILSVSERTVRDWLSRVDKDAKEARDRRIFEMWLACYTQEEIAEAVGITQQAVAKMAEDFTNFGNLADSCKAAGAHLTDFDPPLYNVWKQQTRTPGSAHFGNSETRWHDYTSQRWEV